MSSQLNLMAHLQPRSSSDDDGKEAQLEEESEAAAKPRRQAEPVSVTTPTQSGDARHESATQSNDELTSSSTISASSVKDVVQQKQSQNEKGHAVEQETSTWV